MHIHTLFAPALALVVAGTLALPARAQDAPSAAAASAAARADFDVSLRFGLELRDRLRQAGLAEPRGRALVYVSPAGRPEVSFHLTNVPDSLHASVLPLVQQFLAARPAATPVLMSLRLEGLAPHTEERQVLRGRERPPQPQNLSELRDAMEAVARTNPAGLVEVLTHVRMLVSETGEVTLVEARPTGYDHIDRHLTTIAHTLRFRPARMGGQAMQAWVEMPLQFIRPG